jgi:hypothetical protein
LQSNRDPEPATIASDVTDPEPPLDHFRIHRVSGTSGEALFILWTTIDGRVWVLPSAARTRIEMQLLSERIDENGSFWDLRMPGEIASLIADGLLRLIDLDEHARQTIAEEIEARGTTTDEAENGR